MDDEIPYKEVIYPIEIIDVDKDKIEMLGVGVEKEFKRNNIMLLSFADGEGIMVDIHKDSIIIIPSSERKIGCTVEKYSESECWIFCKAFSDEMLKE